MSKFRESLTVKPFSALLQLAGAVGIAIVQPGYDLLGRYPQFFVARKIETQELLIAVGVLSLVLPLALWLIAMALRLVGRRIYTYYLALVMGVLAAAVVIQLLKSTETLSGEQNLWIGAVVVVVAAAAYLRIGMIATFLQLLSPAAVLFPVLFLFFSPVSKVLFGAQGWLWGPIVENEVVGPKVASTTPVILVVFDELPTPSLMARNGSIDAKSFPAFASLANDATWYRNATTVAAGSLNAIPAILTGRYPVHTYIPNAIDYPENIFSLLGRSYRIVSHEPITGLCAEYFCSAPPPVGLRAGLEALGSDLKVIYGHLLLPNEYAESLPAIDENWMDFSPEPPEFEPVTIDKARKNDQEVVHAIKKQVRDRVIKASGQDYGAVFEASLEDIAMGDQRLLYFQHVQLPHVPWRYLPSGKRYKETFVNGKEGRDQWINEQPWLMAQGLQRHLLQVKYVDGLLGKLVAKLRDSGIYDDALIIVTADHGASFKMGAKRRSTTPNNMPEIAGVPLLIKLPGQQQSDVSEKFVETVDIVPTIADVLGIKVPWGMDGFSLLDTDAPGDRGITVRSIYGYPMALAQDDLQQREWILEFKAQWFGVEEDPGDGIENLFAMGPGKTYLGRAAESLNAQPLDTLQASLVRPAQYQKVYLHSPFSPARVTGQLLSQDFVPENNETLLVAVNGVVQGSGQVFTKEEEAGHFSIMVPSASFVAGANAMDLYWLDTSQGSQPVARYISFTKPLQK